MYYKQNELCHHGVLGMKWGVRHYQPYPPGKKGRFIGKVKEVGQKVKTTVTSEEFKRGAKVVAKVVAIGSVAALGTAFIVSPQGQALMNTAFSKAVGLIEGVKKDLYDRASSAAEKANSYLDEKFGEDFHRTGATLKDLDEKLEKTNMEIAAQSAAQVKVLKEDVSVGKKAIQKVMNPMTVAEDQVANNPATQKAIEEAVKSMASSYLSEKGVTDEQVSQGIEIAEELMKKLK